ncbi:hypothetical protein SAMN05421678_108262 [Actinopolymorpha cephalotaxi]|uniref:Uncharacterized protein n=1 Tax=Actinopolymorpha cephalotaxi TaxID=504797 RepID=A0A1I2UP99_9ACTN|nr:hypothetical protein [Actinopolymorpha cephalotaxi]SFG78878.1 hypothetical protein SAMN05421678_108262 [Actinopolymorpha cephalotaxi]
MAGTTDNRAIPRRRLNVPTVSGPASTSQYPPQAVQAGGSAESLRQWSGSASRRIIRASWSA